MSSIGDLKSRSDFLINNSGELEQQNHELRQLHVDLELSKLSYQALFEQLPLPVIIVDTNGVIEDLNDLASIFAIKNTSRLWSNLSLKNKAIFYSSLRNILPKEKVILNHITFNNIEGIYDLHLISLTTKYRLDRKILIVFIDKRLELLRDKEQQFYSSVLDSTDSCVFVFSPEGEVLLANKATSNLIGDGQSIIGKFRDDLVSIKDELKYKNIDSEILSNNKSVTLEEEFHLPNNIKKYFLSKKFPLYDTFGEIYGIGGISTDITELKEKHYEALLSDKVFLTTQEGIIITDADTIILRANPAFLRQSGYSLSYLIGKKTNILKSGRQDSKFYELMWKSINETGSWSGDINNRHKNGSYYTVLTSINVVKDTNNKLLNYISVQTDVTVLYETQLKLQKQALYDSLTNLPNKSLFNDRLFKLLELSRDNNTEFSILFIDIDRFKEVNDTLGHQIGDELLQIISNRLLNTFPKDCTISRFGGDEFVILLPNYSKSKAIAFSEDALLSINSLIMLSNNLKYRATASIGIALYPKDGVTPDILIRNSDIAMYNSKLNGRNCISVYSRDMTKSNDYAFMIQNELVQAIEHNQLRVYFQPKFRLKDRSIIGAEVLVRWERPNIGLTMPNEFIKLAERAGLLTQLDQWVINESLRNLAIWHKKGIWASDWRLAINQNVADLQHPDMPSVLAELLLGYGVPPTLIELEITEDALLKQTHEQLKCLNDLKNLGISLAIDDFGTGYSSLSYLQNLPISVLKIDISFISKMIENENNAILVKTIIDLAHNLKLSLVAEGVDNEAQVEKLIELGCDLAQGFLFSKPIPTEDFELLLI